MTLCQNEFGETVCMFVCISVVSLFQENCKNMSLRCYMLELMMVIDEEDITGKNADCITDFSDMLPKEHLVSLVN